MKRASPRLTSSLAKSSRDQGLPGASAVGCSADAPGASAAEGSFETARGWDGGSIEYIHRRIVEQRDAGAAVLIVSTELDEVLALGDRVAVMYEGRIVGILDAKEATRERVGLLMGGITK